MPTLPVQPGPLALVGSGEFLPAMSAVDAAMLAGRSPRVAVVPTAAGPEGDASVERWFSLAESHYAALGAEVVRIDVRSRDDAMDPGHAARISDVGMVYLSGGNPGHLADSLRGSPLAEAIATAWLGGAALAGCSAGAMALGRRTLTLRGPVTTGLGLAGRIATIPHFDRFGFASRLAGAAASWATDEDTAVLGIDEDTAVVYEPAARGWVVRGVARAWLVTATGGRGDGFADGDVIPLPVPPTDDGGAGRLSPG